MAGGWKWSIAFEMMELSKCMPNTFAPLGFLVLEKMHTYFCKQQNPLMNLMWNLCEMFILQLRIGRICDELKRTDSKQLHWLIDFTNWLIGLICQQPRRECWKEVLTFFDVLHFYTLVRNKLSKSHNRWNTLKAHPLLWLFVQTNCF